MHKNISGKIIPTNLCGRYSLVFLSYKHNYAAVVNSKKRISQHLFYSTDLHFDHLAIRFVIHVEEYSYSQVCSRWQ